MEKKEIDIFCYPKNGRKRDTKINECNAICAINHIDNGGTLKAKKHTINSDFLVTAEIGGKIIGYVTLRIREEGKLFLSQAAIIPEMQHNGIGTKLYEFVESNFQSFEKIYLHVDRANTISTSFHKKLGYKALDKTEKPLYVKDITQEK